MSVTLRAFSRLDKGASRCIVSYYSRTRFELRSGIHLLLARLGDITLNFSENSAYRIHLSNTSLV